MTLPVKKVLLAITPVASSAGSNVQTCIKSMYSQPSYVNKVNEKLGFQHTQTEREISFSIWVDTAPMYWVNLF